MPCNDYAKAMCLYSSLSYRYLFCRFCVLVLFCFAWLSSEREGAGGGKERELAGRNGRNSFLPPKRCAIIFGGGMSALSLAIPAVRL